METKDGNVVRLAAQACSPETLETFEFYIEQIKLGAIVGAAVILLKPGGGYDVDVIGEAGAQPEYVRGLARVLDDQLGSIIGSRKS